MKQAPLFTRNRSSRIIAVIIFAMLVIDANSQVNSEYLINRQAPPIVFQKAIGNVQAADKFNGNWLVLDFWATWCVPCVASFPHFNKLESKYRNNPNVVFAAITSESEKTVTDFLKRTGKVLNAIKLIDTTSATSNAFGVEFIPFCVVIDDKNIVRWAGIGRNLTEKVLANVLAATPYKLMKPDADRSVQHKPIAQRASFAFNIAVADSSKSSYEGSNYTHRYKNQITLLSETNIPLNQFLENLTGLNQKTRIITNDSVKLRRKYDIFFKAGRDNSLFTSFSDKGLKNEPRTNFLLFLISQSLNIQLSVERKRVAASELVVFDSTLLKRTTSTQKHYARFIDKSDQMVEVAGYTIQETCKFLEGLFGSYFLLEQELPGYVELSLDLSSPEALDLSLKKNGVARRKAVKEVDIIQVLF